MKINNYLINLAISIIIIFGGLFIIKYFRTEDLLLDHLIAAIVGTMLLIASLIWRRKYKKQQN